MQPGEKESPRVFFWNSLTTQLEHNRSLRQQKRDNIKKHEEMRDYLIQNKKELQVEENLAEQMLEAQAQKRSHDATEYFEVEVVQD